MTSILKKQIKKPISRTLQDPVGSDFSSGATLATTGDFPIGSSAPQAGGSERASSVDRIVEGTSLVDNNIDKADESIPGNLADFILCMFYVFPFALGVQVALNIVVPIRTLMHPYFYFSVY